MLTFQRNTIDLFLEKVLRFWSVFKIKLALRSLFPRLTKRMVSFELLVPRRLWMLLRWVFLILFICYIHFSVKLNKSLLNKVVNIVKLSKLKPGFILSFEVAMIAILMHSRRNSESSPLMSHHHLPIRTMLLSVVRKRLPLHVPLS